MQPCGQKQWLGPGIHTPLSQWLGTVHGEAHFLFYLSRWRQGMEMRTSSAAAQSKQQTKHFPEGGWQKLWCSVYVLQTAALAAHGCHL